MARNHGERFFGGESQTDCVVIGREKESVCEKMGLEIYVLKFWFVVFGSDEEDSMKRPLVFEKMSVSDVRLNPPSETFTYCINTEKVKNRATNSGVFVF